MSQYGVWHGLIHCTGWLAPRAHRPEWRRRWIGRLANWWVLVQRGELTRGAASLFFHDALVDALRCRFGKPDFRAWWRRPGLPLAASAGLILLIAALTHGLAATRVLIDAARGRASGPLRTLALNGSEDKLVGYGFLLVFGLVAGILLVARGRLPASGHGWRYWSFLVLKTGMALVLALLLLIEGGPALRARLPGIELKVLAGGLVLGLLFVAAVASVLWWSVADQRRRCPVCLRSLALPVRVGSWASTFDPPTTEFLCECGHGVLTVSEAEGGAPDRWTRLDESWQELFQSRP